MYFSPLFRALPGLQPARACITPACHSQPDNHDAICSDLIELLAPRSEGMYNSVYEAILNGSDAFPANLGPPATSFREECLHTVS